EVGEFEVGRVVRAVLGDLPAPGNPPAAVLEPPGETLRERLALAPEPPLATTDAHLVDPADAAIVGIELVVGPVGCIAADQPHATGCLRHLDRPALDQVGARVVPLERRPRLAGPRLAAGRRRLHTPLADQQLEPGERLLRGGLIHRRLSTRRAGRPGPGR